MHITRTMTFGVAILVSGCVSIIDVKPAQDSSTPGIHYYLPQVFIQITPNTDGSFKVAPVYLPDPANRYAIKADSYFGSYTIDVNRSEEGFLETVSFNSDSTGIAKQLISTQATLRAAEIDTQAAKAQKEAAEAKAATDKQVAKVSAAEEAQKQALTTLLVAQAKLDLLVSLVGTQGAPDDLAKQILAAKLAVAEAKVKHDASIVATNTAVANFAAANGEAKGPALKAMSPVFLKVKMTEDSVTLTQPFDQQELPTWKVPVEAAPATELALRPSTQVARPDPKSRTIIVEVRANKSLRAATLTGFNQVRKTSAATELDPGLLVAALQFDQTTIRIDFPKSIQAGDYQLRFDLDSGTAAKPKVEDHIVDVRVEL